jgi:hypothetical protein
MKRVQSSVAGNRYGRVTQPTPSKGFTDSPRSDISSSAPHSPAQPSRLDFSEYLFLCISAQDDAPVLLQVHAHEYLPNLLIRVKHSISEIYARLFCIEEEESPRPCTNNMILAQNPKTHYMHGNNS